MIAAALFLTLAAAPSANASNAKCVEPGTLDAAIEAVEAMSPAERRGVDLAAFLTAATYDRACRAVASDRADPCASLAGLTIRVPGARSLDWNCRQRRDEARFARALILRDPSAGTACEAFVRGQFGLSGAAAACSALARGGNDADAALCRDVFNATGREASPLRLEGCLGALRLYRGESVDCESLAGRDYLAADLPLCRAAVAFRGAKEAGPAACGGDPLCRVLAGSGPEACEPYARAALAAFAGRRAGPDRDLPETPGPQGAPATSLLDDVFPQRPSFPDAPAAATAAARGAAAFAAASRDAYPTYQNGVLRGPRLYGSEASDEPLLRDLHRLADVNAAYLEGYRPVPALADGAEVRFVHPGRAANRRGAGTPAVLSFVVDARSGGYQLVRAGWLTGPDGRTLGRPAFVAASVFNSAGRDAAAFADAAALAAGETRSFYGVRAADAPKRTPRPLCRARMGR